MKSARDKALEHIRNLYKGKAWCRGVDVYGPNTIVVFYVDSKTCPSWHDVNNRKIYDYAGVSIRWVEVAS